MKENKVTDVEKVDPKEQKNKPTLDKGNYLIEVLVNGQVIKKIAVSNAAINITKLADGGMVIDLK